MSKLWSYIMKEWLQAVIVAFCIFLLVFFGAIRLNNMTADKEQQLYEQCLSYREAALVELFYIHHCDLFFPKKNLTDTHRK